MLIMHYSEIPQRSKGRCKYFDCMLLWWTHTFHIHKLQLWIYQNSVELQNAMEIEFHEMKWLKFKTYFVVTNSTLSTFQSWKYTNNWIRYEFCEMWFVRNDGLSFRIQYGYLELCVLNVNHSLSANNICLKKIPAHRSTHAQCQMSQEFHPETHHSGICLNSCGKSYRSIYGLCNEVKRFSKLNWFIPLKRFKC